MPWYRAGSVAVTNGSAIVTGAGTDFVGNVSIGDGFIAPDRGVYEIAQVVSATQFLLATPYQGATAGGQGYSIKPTQSFARDLALGASQLLNTFGAVRDGIGQGLVPDGSLASPAIRFSADQDTGVARVGNNTLGLVAGGATRMSVGPTGVDLADALSIGGINPRVMLGSNVAAWQIDCPTGTNALTFVERQFSSEKMRIDAGGNVGIGTSQPTSRLDIMLPGAGPRVRFTSATDNPALEMFRYTGSAGLHYGTRVGMKLGAFTIDQAGGASINGHSWVERLRLDDYGNLLVGVSTGSHRLTVRGADGLAVQDLDGNLALQVSYGFSGATAGGESSAPSLLFARKHSATGRTASFAGTVNTSGADYAEYMVKADGCGVIAKGDVCGVDRGGKLTKTWADAISFVVKSTDPSLVGGDTWGAHLPPKPEQPGAEPRGPALPAEPAVDADEGAIEAWRAAQTAYPALLAAYQSEYAAWQHATDTYAADLTAWEQELEAARQRVDRIAFCGQVPCNVAGDFEVGDYIIAAAAGAGIKAIAVRPDEITLQQYMRRIGKVWAIRDGRAWIDVQHG
ncbi:hypothetical protein CA236_01205 [Sphingomonas sp. ABOLG]|uniref:hypothetical protein n=1 Tax=Sphingomonas sp. ABOLG TaxID=1985880 RepID=UPI000F7F46BB|nr:hypothetical protein [Sphingomonas sp. ABOLG]RSV20542.1 hypothetical protein CA236_01205 [Sphingomonas sp. ABOLG]